MFIVADEQPVLVSGKRGLSSATEAEEDRHVALVLAGIGAGMHAEDTLLW